MTVVNLSTYPYVNVATFADAVEVPVCVPDISLWQGNVNADKFIQAGAHGVIIRAGSINNTTGVCYEDDQYQNNINRFAGCLPMGAYWFFRVNRDPIKQAEYFADLLERNEWNIPPVADVEVNPNNDSRSDFARWLTKFCNRLEYLSGMTPMIYTRGYFWNDNVQCAESLGFALQDLWVARYTTYPQPWGNYGDSVKLRPYDWQTWTLWQWSADGNRRGAEFGCESADIDLNRFNGTLAQFYAWCEWQQEPEPTEPEPTGCGELIADLIPLRDRLSELISKWTN